MQEWVECINRRTHANISQGAAAGGCHSGADDAPGSTAQFQGQHPPSTLQHAGWSHRRQLSCVEAVKQAAASVWPRILAVFSKNGTDSSPFPVTSEFTQAVCFLRFHMKKNYQPWRELCGCILNLQNNQC